MSGTNSDTTSVSSNSTGPKGSLASRALPLAAVVAGVIAVIIAFVGLFLCWNYMDYVGQFTTNVPWPGWTGEGATHMRDVITVDNTGPETGEGVSAKLSGMLSNLVTVFVVFAIIYLVTLVLFAIVAYRLSKTATAVIMAVAGALVLVATLVYVYNGYYTSGAYADAPASTEPYDLVSTRYGYVQALLLTFFVHLVIAAGAAAWALSNMKEYAERATGTTTTTTVTTTKARGPAAGAY
jgi:magnesium-transporting ATPase (P-type)